jgi:hypothetical protein
MFARGGSYAVTTWRGRSRYKPALPGDGGRGKGERQ